ncbi:A/G-specific adenine glycosylase [Pararhizobium haloflavum]|uniref:A/G-specific adenine glycosylase n=1 Tax=Pararhizobium haloflavum TaxID=2037914 RepID=UPI001FE08F3D|nr:A/G-specific adenine glycosylase [Pararhizobium haloflavum]
MAEDRAAARPQPALQMADAMLAWYDQHHRALPWRMTPAEQRDGVRPDPYRVWLSEIMLQQTTVQAVKTYFAAFTDRWPTVCDLAAASEEDVLKAWAGLGYYSRARNLKRCADIIVRDHHGRFPGTVEGLRALPGIGDYTAAAIAAIAFDRQAAVVDGNVERVVSRLYAIDTPLPAAKREIRARTEAVTPATRPGDFAQAMMDLGATLCTPRRPSCILCPLRTHCAALTDHDPERFPVKAAKKEKPLRSAAAFVAVDARSRILLRRRPPSGLLASMSEVPTSPFTARSDGETGCGAAPFRAEWQPAGQIRHVFTHFELALTVYRADVGTMSAPDGHWWSPSTDIRSEALPTVFRKVISAALPDTF